jgi:hypothetical protein
VGLPPLPRRPLRPGQQLALLAFALIAPTLVLLQLGSPIPPHFDTMAPPASAQRIVTFGVYLPFDNDPFGYWDAASQCPGVEVFYAFLTLGSGVPLALLAETGAMVPMMALLVLATYRLGRAVGGDVAGGMAALLLFATVLMRSMPYGHGRFVAFAMTSAGLALFLDGRGQPLRLVLAALMMGTAVASHAIIGGLGMTVAAGTLLFWLLSGHVAAAFAGAGLLLAAVLVAFPAIPIAVRWALPYPVLPAAQLAGIGVAVLAARWMPARVSEDGPWARPLLWALAVLVLVTMARHPNSLGVLHDFWFRGRYPVLYFGGALGMACMMGSAHRRWMLAPSVVGVGIGMIAEYVGGRLWTTLEDPNLGVAVEGFVRKADFWYPYVLVLPAACFAAWLWHVLAPRPVVVALLVLLFFPWTQYQDPNYFEHAIPEGWAYQLQLAKGGYWGSTGHRRWSQTEAEFAIIDILRAEVAAGRITTATHVVHVTPYIYLYKDTAHYAAFTGINDDLYVAEYVFDRSNAGGRFYPGERIREAMEARPPYVVVQDETADGRKLADALPELPAALAEYEVLLARDGIRLLRHPSVGGDAARDPVAPGSPASVDES